MSEPSITISFGTLPTSALDPIPNPWQLTIVLENATSKSIAQDCEAFGGPIGSLRRVPHQVTGRSSSPSLATHPFGDPKESHQSLLYNAQPRIPVPSSFSTSPCTSVPKPKCVNCHPHEHTENPQKLSGIVVERLYSPPCPQGNPLTNPSSRVS